VSLGAKPEDNATTAQSNVKGLHHRTASHWYKGGRKKKGEKKLRGRGKGKFEINEGRVKTMERWEVAG